MCILSLSFWTLCHSCCSYYKIYFKNEHPITGALDAHFIWLMVTGWGTQTRAHLLYDGRASAENTYGLGLTRHPGTLTLPVTSLPSLQLKLGLAPIRTSLCQAFPAGQAQDMQLSTTAPEDAKEQTQVSRWDFMAFSTITLGHYTVLFPGHLSVIKKTIHVSSGHTEGLDPTAQWENVQKIVGSKISMQRPVLKNTLSQGYHSNIHRQDISPWNRAKRKGKLWLLPSPYHPELFDNK